MFAVILWILVYLVHVHITSDILLAGIVATLVALLQKGLEELL